MNIENKATDTETAIWLGYHIDNPCGPGCRENYVKLAETAIDRFENPFAIKYLKDKIKEYKD